MPDLGNNSVFSMVDANNNSGTMPSWSGTAAPSTIDDAGRAFQGAVTREWNWRNYTLTAGGTADVKTLTYTVAPAAYYNGQIFSFIANTTNTTTVTINVNALGAKTIKKMVAGVATDLAAGDMVSGARVEIAYNTTGGYFVWTNYDWSTAFTVSGGTISTTQNFTASGYIYAGTSTENAQLTSSSGVSTLFLGKEGTSACKMYYTSASNKLTIAAGAAVGVGLQPPDVMALTSTSLVGITSDFGIGYGVGAGSTVTQITSKSTGVTINAMTGAITMNNAALAASTTVVFQVTNSSVNANDTIIVHRISGGSTSNYIINTDGVGSGFFNIAVRNISAGSLSDALVIRFTIIKSVNS